jgi:hypothetical protein
MLYGKVMRETIKKIGLLLLVSTVVGGLFYTYLAYSATGSLPARWYASSLYAWSWLAAVLTGAGLYAYGAWLHRRLSWQGNVGLPLLASFGGNALVALLVPALCLVGYSAVAHGRFDVRNLLAEHSEVALKWLILTGFAVFGYTLASFMLFSYQQYAVMQLQAVHLKRTQLALQTELLRSQLSPHYLFNSLNTISSLAHRNAGQAEQFVRKLAHTYQYVLDTHDRPLVSLAEELDFVRAYNYLLSVRFEGAIQIREEVAAHLLGCRVPPLTLQMLVENAVKHNAVSREVPLHISIYSDSENHLNVINTIGQAGPAAREHSLKVGLDNIRKRYQYHTNQKIQITREGYFTVRLPLLAGS